MAGTDLDQYSLLAVVDPIVQQGARTPWIDFHTSTLQDTVGSSSQTVQAHLQLNLTTPWQIFVLIYQVCTMQNSVTPPASQLCYPAQAALLKAEAPQYHWHQSMKAC